MAKDYTKYQVEGLEGQFSKARLVQAIIQDYITKNNPSLDQLKTAFPDSLQGGKGVLAKLDEIEKERYFYVKEAITLTDGTQIAIGNQWGKGNIDDFITHANSLGYKINASETAATFDLSEEQIETIQQASYSYELEDLLAELLGKDAVESIDVEPYLETLVNEKEFLGHPTDFYLSTIIAMLNERYGNLCYLAYRQEGDLPEDCAFYENKWGELLEVCKAKIAELGEDDAHDICDSWMGLGASVQMQFTPFNDKDYTHSFADEAYQNAVNMATATSEIMSMASNHLNEEYYQNESLFEQLPARAFELAKSIYDYASICFDNSENCLFKETPYFRQAAVKAAEMRHGQDWAWNNLKGFLEGEGVDVDEIIKESMQNFDTSRTYRFQKATMVTDIRYYEVELTGEMAKLYYEDEDEFWEKFEEEDLEGEWDFVNDRVGDEDNTYKVIH